MMNGEAIGSSDKRIAAVFNSLLNNIRRKDGYGTIKRTLIEEFPLDNPGGWVAGIGDGGSELFSKSCCYFSVAGEEFGEGDGLIGLGFGTFAIEGFVKAPQA